MDLYEFEGRITCHCEEESSWAQRGARVASQFGKKPRLFSTLGLDAGVPKREKNEGQLSRLGSSLLDAPGSQCHRPNVDGTGSISFAQTSGMKSSKDFGTMSFISGPSPAPP